jgi:hypothetical protein
MAPLSRAAPRRAAAVAVVSPTCRLRPNRQAVRFPPARYAVR